MLLLSYSGMAEYGVTDLAGTAFKPENGMKMLFSAVDRKGNAPKFSQKLSVANGGVSTHKQFSSHDLETIHKSDENTMDDYIKLNSVPTPLPGFASAGGLSQQSLMYPMFPLPGHAIMPAPGAVLPAAVLPMGHGSDRIFHLRCIACGLMCKSTVDLHQHIMKKHLNSENVKIINNTSSAYDLHSKTASAETQVKETQGSSSENTQTSKQQLQFPVVKSNFPLFSMPGLSTNEDSVLTKTSNASSDKRQDYHGSKAVPQLQPHLNTSAYLHSQNTFGHLHPFLGLAYPNVMSTSNIYTPGSISTVVPTPMSLCTMNPYLGFPNTPGNGLPSQFPYISGLPMMVNHLPDRTSGKDHAALKRPLVEPEAKMKTKVSVDSNGYLESTDKRAYVSTTPEQSRHAELIRRRMSAPLIGLNKDFRFINSYNRFGNRPSLSGFDSVVETNEPADLPPKHSHKVRRESVPDKATTSRLNAKSIEQHISKLISNNEKVLLNPVLERVKPRRVFRRNSLDPASLSSYSTGLTRKNNAEGLQLKYLEDASKCSNKHTDINAVITRHYQGFPSDQMPLPPGMTTSEYNKMIQLTRAPYYSNAPSNVSSDDQEVPSFIASGHGKGGEDSFLGKRSHSTSATPNMSKKARRTTFFECNDCGVRYRKEENYVIHKRVYCKYRKDGPNHLSQPHNDIFGGKHLNMQETLAESAVRRRVIPSSHALSTIHSASNNEGFYTKIIPPSSSEKYFSDPLKSIHQDLCRTKSADAALQSEATMEISKQEKETKGICTDSEHLEGTVGQSRIDTQGPVSNIPTSKLPPNKRHVHLLRCSDLSKERLYDASSLTHCSTNSPLSQGSSENAVPQIDTRPANLNAKNCTEPSDFNSSIAGFNEMSVPRSNYKLLLHQISLRNMQDIELLSDTNGKKSRSSRRVSMDHSTLTSTPTNEKNFKHHRSFSTCIPPSATALAVFPHNNQQSADTGVYRHKAVGKQDTAPQPENFNATRPQTGREIDVIKINKRFEAFDQPLVKEFRPKIDENHNLKSEKDAIAVQNKVPLLPPTSLNGVKVTNGKLANEDQCPVVVEKKTTVDLSTKPIAIFNKGSKYEQVSSPVVTSTLLFPHQHPSVACNSHVTFCCVLNTQPAYVEIPKPRKENKKSCSQHTSMYSQWAVSDPILVPTDLSVVDLLNGWRRSNGNDYMGKGVFVNTNCSSDLICTDNKSYEKEISKRQKKCDRTSPNEIAITPEADSSSDQARPSVPVGDPSTLVRSAAAIYASCSDCRIQVGAVSSVTPKTLGPARDEDVSFTTAATTTTQLPQESALSESDTSSSPSPMPPKVPKIKKRKSRKERSAASPREQRRSLYSRSPPSPCLKAVHHGKANSSDTEDRFSGCALCNIKAGRSDLIRDVNSACKPCRELVKTSGHKVSEAPSTKGIAAQSIVVKPNHYLSPPAQSSAYLDKTRASTGSTQHWVSTIAHESSGNVFRYPSPNSIRNSMSEKGTCDGCNSGSSPTNPNLSPGVPLDMERQPIDGVNATMSPSLAEVVSEVMRTAAMQSMRHSKSKKKHPLTGSRPLHPVSYITSPNEYVLPWTSLKTSVHNKMDKPWQSNEIREPPEKKNKTYTDNIREINRSELCDIILTPATPTKEYDVPRENVSPSNQQPADNSASTRNSEYLNESAKLLIKENYPGFSRHQTSVKLASKLESDPATIEISGDESPDDGSSEGEDVKEYDDVATSSVARPYKCDECRVAFRIGGHLAKHLRSKGHTVAMQKKTLNRLKQQQHRIGATPLRASMSDAVDFINNNQLGEGAAAQINGSETVVSSASSKNSQPCEVKALFEGNDEYACVPNIVNDDVFSVDVTTDELGGPHDPRPFKCIACKVAFRFQGHLDRHFRSNLHLIAVGHYEQEGSASINCSVSESDANGDSQLTQSDDEQTRKNGTDVGDVHLSCHENNRSSSNSDQDIEVVAVSSDGDDEIVSQTNITKMCHIKDAASSRPYQILQGGASALDCRAQGHQLLIRCHQEHNGLLSSRQPSDGEVLCERNITGDEGVSMRVSESAAHVLAVPL